MEWHVQEPLNTNRAIQSRSVRQVCIVGWGYKGLLHDWLKHCSYGKGILERLSGGQFLLSSLCARVGRYADRGDPRPGKPSYVSVNLTCEPPLEHNWLKYSMNFRACAFRLDIRSHPVSKQLSLGPSLLT